MNEPIDIVAEMRGSLIALSYTTDITRDKINRWATEVERLQAENARLRVLPEQIKQLSAEWEKKYMRIYGLSAREMDYELLDKGELLEASSTELLALLNPQTGDSK